ncbi:MAG: 4Fe-4S dicluster domain-containing protein [Bilophila sp.]
MLFTAVDGGFVLEGITDKGRALLDGAGFADGDGQKGRRGSPPTRRPPRPSLAPPRSGRTSRPRWRPFHGSRFWIKQTAKCLSCGACTYLCPTCQCFTITDEGSPSKAAVCAVGIHACRLSSRWKPAGTTPARKSSSVCATASAQVQLLPPVLRRGVFLRGLRPMRDEASPVSLDIRRVVAERVLERRALA